MKPDSIPLEWLSTLPRRYAATVIDGMLILAAIVFPTALWPADATEARLGRIVVAVGALLVYEPLCTGHFVTLGRKLAGVRVRSYRTGAKIGVLRAYGRTDLKVFLGFLSFLVLPFTNGHRAIHDMATDSIVVCS